MEMKYNDKGGPKGRLVIVRYDVKFNNQPKLDFVSNQG